jgi:hypothetical protein
LSTIRAPCNQRRAAPDIKGECSSALILSLLLARGAARFDRSIVMATAQHASHHGQSFFHSSFQARGSDARRGSPLAIFRGIASGVALLAVTSAALAAVVHLAHLINASWRIY